MEVQKINSSTKQQPNRNLFTKKKILLFSVLVVFLTGIGFALYLYNKPHVSVINETPAFRMDAFTLVTEYDKNEKEANSKYLGKIIEVTGIVAEKSKDANGNFNITLQGPDLAGIGCEFDPNAKMLVNTIKEGQQVKVKGICTGVLMDVVLVDCYIVPESVSSN